MIELVRAVTEMCKTITSSIKYFRGEHEKMEIYPIAKDENFARQQKAQADLAELKISIAKEKLKAAQDALEIGIAAASGKDQEGRCLESHARLLNEIE